MWDYRDKGLYMYKKFYAHSLDGRPKEEWQGLEEHLKEVAGLARLFAQDFFKKKDENRQ